MCVCVCDVNRLVNCVGINSANWLARRRCSYSSLIATQSSPLIYASCLTSKWAKKKGRRSKFCALVASSQNFEERKACRKRQFGEAFEMHALVYSHCPARCHAMTAAHFCWPCKYSPTHPTPTAMAKIVAVAVFKGNITYKTLLPS